MGEPDPVKEMQPILEESAATSQEEGKMTSQSVTRGAPEEYNVFIGQVPFECTAEELQEVFRQQGIENIVLRLHKGRRARGTAFGVCSSKKDFDLALSVHGKGFQGRRLVVEKAKSARQARKDTDEQYTPRRVFMGQLPYQATVADIQKHMTSLGVGQLKIRLLTDRRTKKSRGIAFADCKDDKQLVRALRAHHTSLLGKVINVERTVGGGGKGDRRKAKIQRLRERQGAKVHKDTKKIVASVISQSESCPVTLEDIDDRAIGKPSFQNSILYSFMLAINRGPWYFSETSC